MDKSTQFGRYLSERAISYEDAAKALEITRSYVGMLVRGDHAPGMALAFRISDWTEGAVPAGSWAS